MVKHYITKYECENTLWFESWLQINLFGKCFCFSKKRIPIVENLDKMFELNV